MSQPARALERTEPPAVVLVHEILCLTGSESMQAAPLLKELLLLVAPDHPGARQIDLEYRSHLSDKYEIAQDALQTAWRYCEKHQALFEDWLKEDVTY